MTALAVDRHVELMVGAATQSREEELDGCCALLTDLRASRAPGRVPWDRYWDLQRVERDFGTLKAVLPELRPVFECNAGRARSRTGCDAGA